MPVTPIHERFPPTNPICPSLAAIPSAFISPSRFDCSYCLCCSAHQRAREGVEAGIFRVDDTLHRRLEDAVRSIREPTAGPRRLSTSAVTAVSFAGRPASGRGRARSEKPARLSSRAQSCSRQFRGRVDGVSVQTSSLTHAQQKRVDDAVLPVEKSRTQIKFFGPKLTCCLYAVCIHRQK